MLIAFSPKSGKVPVLYLHTGCKAAKLSSCKAFMLRRHLTTHFPSSSVRALQAKKKRPRRPNAKIKQQPPPAKPKAGGRDSLNRSDRSAREPPALLIGTSQRRESLRRSTYRKTTILRWRFRVAAAPTRLKI